MYNSRKLNKDLTEKLVSFIESDDKKLILDDKDYSPTTIQEALEDIGMKVEMDTETNGWQVDYWATATKSDKIYNVFGTAWFGDVEIIKE